MAPHLQEPSSDLLRRILDSIDLAAFAFGKDRKILFANKKALEMLRIDPDRTAVGAGEEMHFESNKYFDEHGRMLDYPKGSAFELAFDGIETRNLLIEHRNLKDHRHVWLDISCTPVLDEKGEFQYGVMSYRDVIARKSRDDKLKFLLESAKILSIATVFEERLNEKAKLTVPSLADWCSIDILDPGGELVRKALVHRSPGQIAKLNEYQQKYFWSTGVESAAQRVARTGIAEFTPLITEELIDSVPDITNEQKEDTKEIGLTSLMVLPIGSPERILGVLSVAYAESGRLYTQHDFDFFVEFSHHLSVLLENALLYQEIRQRDQAKDAFLASLSHELRNPLAPIKSALELMRLQNEPEGVSEEVGIIEHQFDHMARLLNDLLDTTRFIRGAITLTKEPVELRSVLQHVSSAVGPIVRSRGIEFNLGLPAHELHLMGDRTRLEQAITNIINNAAKFTPEGGSVSVTVSHDDRNAIIEIKDTGAGITKEEMPHIFEPYYQGERVRNGNNGLGVGLRLVHEIVRLHGGTVEAMSEGQGKGSTFTITLPLGAGE